MDTEALARLYDNCLTGVARFKYIREAKRRVSRWGSEDDPQLRKVQKINAKYTPNRKMKFNAL